MPRMAELLGMEVGEEFVCPPYTGVFHVDTEGCIVGRNDEMATEEVIYQAIEYPNELKKVIPLDMPEEYILLGMFAYGYTTVYIDFTGKNIAFSQGGCGELALIPIRCFPRLREYLEAHNELDLTTIYLEKV